MQSNHIWYHRLPGYAYLTAIIGISLAYSSPGFAFGSNDESSGDIHALITTEALKGTICDGNLELIEKACSSQHAAGSAAAKDARRHFDDNNLTKSVAYLDREKKTMLNYAADADTNIDDRAHALYHFGLMLHTAQEFYSKSNYIELKLQQAASRGTVPDPYNLDLVDWSKLAESYPGLQAGSPLFDKGTPDKAEAKMSTTGKVTYYQIAKELAIRETQRQWNFFERLARNKFGPRATAILTALKEASCPANLKLGDSD